MGKRFTVLCLFLFLFLGSIVSGQNILLSPAKGYFLDSPNNLKFKLLFAPTDSLIFNWSFPGGGSPSDLKIKVGSSPGFYDVTETPAANERFSTIPGNSPLNMTTGRYYVILTNSDADNLNDIKADYLANPNTIFYSNESQFVVEALTAPIALSPLGVTENPTPLFEWTSVPGVISYFLIVSSTPFEVVTLPNGEVSVEGANLIWEYITSETSIQYGEVDPNAPYNLVPPPLIPGTEYNYTILNLYDTENIAYGSSVFSGVNSFTFEGVSTIDPPNLVAPADQSIFYGEETITFQWDPVTNVNSYTLYLFQRVTSFAGNNQEIDVPIWNTTTTNTQVDYPARTTLTKGNYVWNVIPNDDQGAGSISDTYLFEYILDVGKFVTTARTTRDGSNLLNFQFEVNAIENGVSPANPYVVSNSQSFTDSLVVGLYEFTASKTGFYDSTFTVEITQTGTASAALWLRPYPSVISGEVNNQDGAAVTNADVTFTNILTAEDFMVATDGSGDFSATLPKATYSIDVTKAGYLVPDEILVTANEDQVVIPDPLILTLDNAFVSGKMINDLGQPVKQATVVATKGTITQQVSSNASGNYSFTLSSGNWSISASKTGFISPTPLPLSLSTGDNLQNQNLTIIPRANQVSGFVYRVTSGGTTPFQGITVTATPNSGSPVTATTSQTGEFSLSVRSGTYTISVSKTGFTASDPVQLTLGVGQTVSGVNFNLTPNPSSISGVITLPNGTALGGATVYTNSGVTTTSLSNGTYTLSVSSGTRIVNVEKSGYIPPSAKTVSVSAGQNLTGINFEMSPNAGTISGKVTNLQQPLVNATITVTAGSQSYTTVTNSTGNYTISLPPSTYSVKASKTGFETSSALTITVGPGQVSPNNNFSLIEKIATFEGTVTSLAGAQLNNAQIVLTETGNASNTSNTISNVNGNFAISVEAGKSYDLTISKTGYSTYSDSYENLVSGSSLTVNATLTANPSSVAGRVKDNIQNNLSGVAIKIYNQSGTLVKTVTTTANGTYNSGLTAGTYKIKASKAGYAPDSANVTLVLGQNLTNINFTLPENFAFITGTVKDFSGNGLQDATINLIGNTGGATVLSGSGGTYSIQSLIGGTYNITVEKDGYSDTTISNYTIADGDSKIINYTLFQLNGEISGVVQDNLGNPINEATVVLVRKSNNFTSTKTSLSDGSFSFTGLNFGEFDIYALKSGFLQSSTQTLTLTLLNPVQTVAIGDLIEKNSVISGSIRDDAGLTLSGVAISVYSSFGSGGAVTNNAGEFEIAQLAPGDYQLLAEKTGYGSIDSTFTLNQSFTLSLVMPKNTSSITGSVRNQLGEVLPFTVPITAVTEDRSVFTGQTNAAGNYTINGVPDEADFTIFTEVFREGYINDTTQFRIDNGVSSVTINLEVQENQSAISGNVGAGNVAVQLTNNGTGDIKTISSSASGAFLFEFLDEGSYTIKPTLAGYAFTPATIDVSLGTKDSVNNVDFTAAESIGSITVLVRTSAEVGIDQATVSVVSQDQSTVRSGVTNTQGSVVFSNLPANKTYIITPSKDGYSADPVSSTEALGVGEDATASFVMSRNNSELKGLVYRLASGDKIPIPDATVIVKYNSGQTFSGVSGDDGTYSIPNLPAGDTRVSATKSGYVSNTYSVTLSNSVYNREILMTAAIVRIRGYVKYKGEGVENVNMSLSSSSTQSTTTSASGYFLFEGVGIKTGANDTTLFLLGINDDNYPALSQVITIPRSLAGTMIDAENFILPSGSVTITVTDGQAVVPGVKVTFTKPDGVSDVVVTGVEGKYVSEENLVAGQYRVSLEKKGYLTPLDVSTNVILESDTTVVDTTFKMPYRFSQIDSLFANVATEVSINYSGDQTGVEATLYYRKNTAANFKTVAMSAAGDKFSGFIPALFTLEDIVYYVNVLDNNTGISYTSAEYTITPLASGILSNIILKPALTGLTLRAEDIYTVSLVIRDGLNASLEDQFTGPNHPGSIDWNIAEAPGISIEYPNTTDSTVAIIKPTAEGLNEITITTVLGGVSQVKVVRFNVSTIPLKELEVFSPVRRISNKTGGVQLSYSGIDTLNQQITLGSEVTWSLIPTNAGIITETGFYSPDDTTYIGFPEIILGDNLSDVTSSANMVVFAELSPEGSFMLKDNSGMQLNVPTGAVNIPVEISLEQPQFGPAKQQFTPLGSGGTYTVSENLYNFQYRSSLGLPGDSLLKPATLSLPVDNSLKFFDGGKKVAYYNPQSKIWRLFESTDNSSSLSMSSFAKFGEYGVLTQNEPLGLKHVAVLPSPFSPQVAPLKIGYFLTTPDRSASVTIKIYNIRGELVRTLLENDFQISGRYGSRAGIKEITWDGKTNGGYLARNGRYIIKIDARDSTGEKSEIVQVVLVK
ncbi:MAG: hypothetical protein SCALA702_37240 [Melioribacteraceae bacterium]|nr:MAG: hypothetical protein SCALA702_37240 [Melioribacteraceae bacterium]